MVIEYLPSPEEEYQPRLGPIIQEMPFTGPRITELPQEMTGPLVPELPELIEKFQEEEAQRDYVPVQFKPEEIPAVRMPPPVAPKPKVHVATPPAQPVGRRLPTVRPMQPLTEVKSPIIVPDFKMRYRAPPVFEKEDEPPVHLPPAQPSKPFQIDHVAPMEKPTIFKFKEPQEIYR